ncbi:hypothetical protein BH18ACT4_BH18ACT4_05250 [soil metagenome]
MDTTVVEVTLPNGATALVRAAHADGGAAPRTSFTESFDFDMVGLALGGIADSIKSALARAAPDSVTVNLGLEVAVQAGKLTALLVEGSGTASLNVTLEWHRADA